MYRLSLYAASSPSSVVLACSVKVVGASLQPRCLLSVSHQSISVVQLAVMYRPVK